ncbi:ROK family transcriptional regulator [Ruania alkalisoli]|uniref:ROK family transcriptional regulator n=1 Tax=Ruania alkalisoli TaxID=2779775 RepID=A0A7M1SU35_9MICO|nr:ROK family transcriptional regulator [Ruania alkalisoli]QOR71099.1 ROK family transcriptional regulator [Ruania alkalisoli]
MTDHVGGSLQSLRESNRERLIALLREHGALHRAELARRAGVSRATVTTIVNELLAGGVVVEGAGSEPANGGPTAKRAALTLNPEAGVIVGLDFSAGSVTGVIADLSHQVLADGTRALAPQLGWMGRLDVGVELIDEMRADAGVTGRPLAGVGLGIPGPVDWTTGEIGTSSKSLEWAGARPSAQLAERLGVPVRQDNTAHLGALAEAVWGAARGSRHVVYVKVSAGLSAGLVIDGQMCRGALGATGALGHTCAVPDGPLCSCGSRGCLELYAATPAILEAVRPHHPDASFEGVAERAADGDRPCRRALADAATMLGRSLAGVCNLLNPESIIVGGDLTAAGDLVMGPLRTAVTDHALPIATQALSIGWGDLGDRAGAMGGVALMLQEPESIGASS